MKKVGKYLFVSVWILLAIALAIISLRYKSRTEALVAVVTSQEVSISFKSPVVVSNIFVIPGQEVNQGDTLLIVSRPDLELDIEQKLNEIESLQSNIIQAEHDFLSRIELLKLERDSKINRLTAELNTIKTELNQQAIIKQRLSSNESINLSDSVVLIQAQAIEQEIADLNRYFAKEIGRKRSMLNDDLEIMGRSLALTKRELESLYDQKGNLIRTARFKGVVGTLTAQIDELVAPYKTLLSLYEAQPTLIKAFQNEQLAVIVSPGDSVRVVSENRLYSAMGVVIELGARITNYPDKIQPINAQTLSYGQEIFIEISSQNTFLNGEKVFVYKKENEVN
ncbi:MAG: multidrug resistance efflux pump [Marinoscillum sp.]